MSPWMRVALISAGLIVTVPAAAQVTSAKVTGGTVSGTIAPDISIFRGIPFSAPPVGALRWKAPQPVTPWQGSKQTTSFAPACMQEPKMAQQMGQTGPFSEDCLYLNVWTPAKKATEKLPVIVWIYGGGFSGGTTSIPLYDGGNFARKGVVFVSIAYRVGPMGFLADPALSEENGHGSGAYGLLDQIAGLEWVKANVGQFGGDPNRVTLLGHSAGGYAVSTLAASPLAKGLFHGIIAESGANFAPAHAGNAGGSRLETLAASEVKGARFLAGLGATDLKAARALSADAIQHAADQPGAPRFGPPLDGYVLPANQIALWKAGRFNDTPILIGSNSDEAASFGTRQLTPAAFEAEVRKDYGAKADVLLSAYPHATSEDATRAGKQLRRDTAYGWPTYAWADLQTQKGQGKAYVYYFDRPTAQNPDGSPHGEEVAIVFNNPDQRPGRPAWTEADHALSNQMQSYWVNFAKTGNPNGSGLPEWPAFGSGQSVMRLGIKTGPGPIPNLDKLKALDIYYDWLASQTP